MKMKFNLVTDPWIKVFNEENFQEELVSLSDLFKNTRDYHMLAGEMHSQDLAIMRFILAILTTVYSRVDANGKAYPWVANNDLKKWPKVKRDEVLLETWKAVYKADNFSQVVTDYLDSHADEFEFFGGRPFYQVSATDYDTHVPASKSVASGKGQVLAMQINRTISQSGNSVSLFSPKTDSTKNKLSVDELIRWVIMYQNYTGVTDKTKVNTANGVEFRTNPGWLYKTTPIYAKGFDLFDTLMLNLILVSPENGGDQKPAWEYNSVTEYLQDRQQKRVPDNLAELYTSCTRLLHIEFKHPDEPIIYSAALPTFNGIKAFIEPMTGWQLSKKAAGFEPIYTMLNSHKKKIWQHFDEYFSDKTKHKPRIVDWLKTIHDSVSLRPHTSLASTILISENNRASQHPAFELTDDFNISFDVLFNDKWANMIDEAVEISRKVSLDYYHFIADLAQVRNTDVAGLAARMQPFFSDSISERFVEWVDLLKLTDDLNMQFNEWKKQLTEVVKIQADDDLRSSSPRDITGIQTDSGIMNIFTISKWFKYQAAKDIDLKR